MIVHIKSPPCCQCTESFTDKKLLKSNLRICLKENPYPCTQCTESFKSHADILQHIKTHLGGGNLGTVSRDIGAHGTTSRQKVQHAKSIESQKVFMLFEG